MQPSKKKPVNLSILKVTELESKNIAKIKTGQIFSNGNAFHEEGLFSTSIFGGMGSPSRNSKFGIIDLGLDILHPLVYRSVVALKSLHSLIIDGKAKAIFDKKTKMFVKSDDPEARTGMAFFLEHINQLEYEDSPSDERKFQVKLIKKTAKEDGLTIRYHLVIPAGIRDYIVDENGRPQEDEINALYRRLIAGASIVDPAVYRKNPSSYDSIASSQQRAAMELYEYLEQMLDGKNKFILGKWVSRKIFNSTRNVITSYVNNFPKGDDPRRLKFNETLVGLHQFSRASAPLSIYELKNKYIRDIFIENSNTAYLTNAKTLKREELSSMQIQKDYDKWTSSEGLERVIASLGNLDLRERPITLNRNKHYMGLVYRDENIFKFFQDIDDLPEGLSRENVHPVTLIEFIYMSIGHMDAKYGGFVTRYPITGYGSIYPAIVRVTTTTDTSILTELDPNWEKTDRVLVNFPVLGSGHFNSQCVHHSHLGALGGDHDGDQVSLIMVLSDEANSEIQRVLNSKQYYTSDTGNFIFSSDTDVLAASLAYLT